MSPRPDSPATPQGRMRHSYDDLFGDEPVPDRPDQPDQPEPPDAAAGLPDAPVDDEPYLPPAARAAQAQPAASEELEELAQPVRAARPVDTGRLYHSAGATEAAAGLGAIPAVPGEHTRHPEPTEPPAEQVMPASVEGQARLGGSADRGLTYLGAVTVIGVPTLLVGLAQALIWNRIGWLTGLVLLATTAYAALTTRHADHSAAVVVPPLAFLATTLLAGQLTLPDGVSLTVREGFMIVRTLAENAPWVLGATALAAVIVVVRRRRAQQPTSSAS